MNILEYYMQEAKEMTKFQRNDIISVTAEGKVTYTDGLGVPTTVVINGENYSNLLKKATFSLVKRAFVVGAVYQDRSGVLWLRQNPSDSISGSPWKKVYSPVGGWVSQPTDTAALTLLVPEA